MYIKWDLEVLPDRLVQQRKYFIVISVHMSRYFNTNFIKVKKYYKRNLLPLPKRERKSVALSLNVDQRDTP